MSTPAAQHAPGLASAEDLAARARGLTKAYGSGETTVLALDSVDVDIARGAGGALVHAHVQLGLRHTSKLAPNR